MSERIYCEVCGSHYESSKPHECLAKRLGAIGSTDTGTNGIPSPLRSPLRDPLKDGFEMLSDDEVVSYRESQEIADDQRSINGP